MASLVTLDDLLLYECFKGDVDAASVNIHFALESSPGGTIYCTWTQPTRDYTVFLESMREDDPHRSLFQLRTVPGGLYAQEVVAGGQGIGAVFDQLAELYPLDESRVRIEIYRKDSAAIALSPVAEGVNP